MNKKIIIDFTIKDGHITNSVVFENSPTVYEAIKALDSAMKMFKKKIIEKADKDSISDDEFDEYLKGISVNELD